MTDILASLLGVSMAVSSGMAKSLGLFVVNTFGVTEFWMPALIGGLAFPLLVLMGWSLNLSLIHISILHAIHADANQTA